MWSVLRMVCLVTGVLVWYCLAFAVLWSLAVSAIQRSGRTVFPSSPLLAPAQTTPSAGRVGERRGRCWSDVPGWVARDRAWAAAVVLLGAPAIADRTHQHVNFADRRVDWAGLLGQAAGWPEAERLLVLVAYDLSAAAGSTALPLPPPPVSLHDIAEAGPSTVARVTAAIDLTGGRSSYADSVARAGGLG